MLSVCLLWVGRKGPWPDLHPMSEKGSQARISKIHDIDCPIDRTSLNKYQLFH